MAQHKGPTGVDLASGAWLAVAFSDQKYAGACVTETFKDICEEYTHVDEIFVDIPIGLLSSDLRESPSDELSRPCAPHARTVVSDRYRSVFTPPCWEAVKAASAGASYSTVAAKDEEVTNKGLSEQACALAPAIGAVDGF
jgi:predicted RNase H-like nuclease